MRFLIFNVVVAGALIFLFAGDKADLHVAADRAHAAATDLKTKAFEVIGAKRAPVPPAAAKPASRPVPVEPAEKKAVAANIGKNAKPPVAETHDDPAPGTAAADAVREVQVATRKLVPPLSPAVAKRRAEVLAEGTVGRKSSTVGDNTGKQKFMAASERKRDLMLLSEEMELFSARSIGR